MKKIKTILIFLSFLLLLNSCNTIKGLFTSLDDFSNLKFKLGKVENFKVSTIDISNISSTNSISATDVLILTKSILNKQLPAEFTLNLLANNPTNNNAKKQSKAIIENLSWILYIDDKETINGIVNTPIQILTGATSEIPVQINLDLYKFFSDKGYDDLMNMALAIGGANGSSSRLKLKIKPTVQIAGVSFKYPNYITVVEKEFRSK
ncbi:MAG: hypothetical protein GX372_04465 [Ignavibacteria bacterium]|jgi:hypothetical protein|nr:hypothetical protein [Ignavibacteria bacterium]